MPKKKKIKPVSSEISERELRLRELTDQSLQLLDQLAEARTQLIESREETEAASGELETLRQQIEQLESAQQLLERTLGDSRRRVRTSRSLRSVGKARAEPGDVDVVYWVPQTQAVDEAWLKAAVKAVHKTQGATCTLVCPKGLESASLEAIDGLTLLAADSPWPGHVFNLAVVSTDAPLVLIMAVGVDLAKSALSELGGLSDESVGFGIPRIEQDGVEASLGLVEIEDLELTRCPAAQVDAESGTCDFAAPEAFFIQRAAFQQLGTFDEDLRGPAVL
ncbi:MAG: hypothetical protein VX951_04555, partial [Planctomycetota bacterium]|nr:hypothetical protein [Planctomycetota bacterium]